MPKRPAVTNLDEVKKTAELFAHLDVQPNPKFPFLVSHPYVNTIPVLLPIPGEKARVVDPLTDSEGWALYKARLIQKIQSEPSALHIMFGLTQTYRFTFLKHIQEYLDPSDLGRCLRYIWTQSEFTNDNKIFTNAALARLFVQSDTMTLMTPDELQVYCNLPDELTIYRGVSSLNGKKTKGLQLDIVARTSAMVRPPVRR